MTSLPSHCFQCWYFFCLFPKVDFATGVSFREGIFHTLGMTHKD